MNMHLMISNRKLSSLSIILVFSVLVFFLKYHDITIKNYILVKGESLFHIIENRTVDSLPELKFRESEDHIPDSELNNIVDNITIELSYVRKNMLLDIQHDRVNKIKLFSIQNEPPMRIIIANNDTKYWNSVNKLPHVKSVSYTCTLNSDKTSSKAIPSCTKRNSQYKSIISSCNRYDHDNNTTSRYCWKDINSTLVQTKISQEVLNSKFTPQAFFVHVIPYGIIDQYGNVRSSEAVITPCACHYNMMDVVDTKIKINTNKKEEEVFVISQFWGYGYFHFTIENLPRLAVYIKFLQANEHIKIHVSAMKGLIWQKVPSFIGGFLTILGIDSSRIISGNVLGGIVYLPQGGCCGSLNQPSGHILTTYFHKHIQTFIKQSIHPLDRRTTASISLPGMINSKVNPRNLILIKRKSRRWLKDHDVISTELQKKATNAGLNFLIYDDSNLPNLEETMVMFYYAVLVIGPHGAGLSNIIFSKRNTFIIELFCRAEFVPCYKDLAEKIGMHYYGLWAIQYEPPYSDKRRCGSMAFNLHELYGAVDFYLSQTELQ